MAVKNSETPHLFWRFSSMFGDKMFLEVRQGVIKFRTTKRTITHPRDIQTKILHVQFETRLSMR